jgi:hypothetical protein
MVRLLKFEDLGCVATQKTSNPVFPCHLQFIVKCMVYTFCENEAVYKNMEVIVCTATPVVVQF